MKMPTRARECLALRFRQNWMAKHPVDMPNNGVPLDDSLTSLSWLQNLNIMKTLNPTPPASPEPDTPQNIADLFKQRPGDARVNPNAVLNMSHQQQQVKHESLPLGGAYNNHVFSHRSAQHCSLGGVEVSPPIATSYNQYHDKIDYKTNSSVKPPYSYATLICMAMRESKKNKITLAGIYNWITENFVYYRVADPSWQNSIRHNLSLNKCFQKVARRKDEPGKGGFWRINPEYSDMFVNGVFKKRRAGGSPGGAMLGAREPALPAFSPAKRIKLEPQDDADEGYLAAMAISNELSGSTEDNSQVDPLHDRNIQGLHESLSDHRGIVKSDFNWNAIFHQDIEVSGFRIKTEDIIDAGGDSCDSGSLLGEDNMESPITALSPPASDSNSDVGLEDLLNPDLSTDVLDGPLDLSTGGELDLTITGHSLKAPDWWSESISRGLMSPEHPSSSGLNTPVASSPVPDNEHEVHPWAEHRSLDEAIASFDLDLQNLFEDDTLSAPSLGDS